MGHSFEMLFTISGLIFLAIGITSFFFLPNVLDKSTLDKSNHIKWWTNRSVLILFVATAAMFTAFSSYFTTMPLFFTQELKLDSDLPGYMFSLCAFIEIPLMFLAARLAKAFGLKSIVIIGAASMAVFLALLLVTRDPYHLLAVGFFSALFIAFVSSMGMVFFQELLPEIPGQATSLFINASTAGQIIGGSLIALAESGSYLIIYQVGFVIAIVGTLLVFFVTKPPRVS